MSAVALPIVILVIATLSGWVAIDAARRSRAWFVWAALVAGTAGLGLPVWLAVRRRSPAVIQLDPVHALIVFLTPLLSLLLFAALSALIAASFVFQVARVEGQAMAPTMKDQDRLLVNRMAFRVHHPERGDIVMFRYPLDPAKSFVKRIIAEGGDRVEIIEGRVHLNGVRLDDTFVAAESRGQGSWGPQVVPQGFYFVLGDRRNNSSDSRHWGSVPRQYILGKVQVRWWPPSDARTF